MRGSGTAGCPRSPRRAGSTGPDGSASARPAGHRADVGHADPRLCEWVIAEMDRTRPEIAAGLHDCFETIDTVPLLDKIEAPVLLLSGDRSRIASEQQRALVARLPHGRLEVFEGYGHGVNLLQPERCARASLDFWRALELAV